MKALGYILWTALLNSQGDRRTGGCRIQGDPNLFLPRQTVCISIKPYCFQRFATQSGKTKKSAKQNDELFTGKNGSFFDLFC
jgi:hypothetical protein